MIYNFVIKNGCKKIKNKLFYSIIDLVKFHYKKSTILFSCKFNLSSKYLSNYENLGDNWHTLYGFKSFCSLKENSVKFCWRYSVNNNIQIACFVHSNGYCAKLRIGDVELGKTINYKIELTKNCAYFYLLNKNGTKHKVFHFPKNHFFLSKKIFPELKSHIDRDFVITIDEKFFG